MAILTNCLMCDKEFSTSASGSRICDDCNGNNEARAKEKERWNGLSK